MPHDAIIRRSEIAESDEVARLFRRVRQQCLPYLPDLHTPEEDRAFFRGHVFARCAVWVAAGSAICGFCAFREGWVDHLYVDPAHHGRGLGARLLGAAKAAQPRIELWVFQKNVRAIGFYEAQGFRLVRLTDGRDNEEHEPDALYAWSR